MVVSRSKGNASFLKCGKEARMEKYMDADKRMTAAEAIGRFVNDGESFVLPIASIACPRAHP